MNAYNPCYRQSQAKKMFQKCYMIYVNGIQRLGGGDHFQNGVCMRTQNHILRMPGSHYAWMFFNYQMTVSNLQISCLRRSKAKIMIQIYTIIYSNGINMLRGGGLRVGVRGWGGVEWGHFKNKG